MYFHDLHGRLIEHLKGCIQKGELTERGLARVTGISQPHIHNVLKGKKMLSPQSADEVLRRLHVNLWDLVRPGEFGGPAEGRNRL